MHVFWRCEGALAVRAALQAELARLGVPAPLRRLHLWLMLRPSRAIHNDLWRVMCLAAFAGMDAGRCAAWLVPRTAPLRPGHLVARIVRTCALATFHAMLADYAALGVCRPAARASVAAPRPAFSSPRTRTTRARSRSGRPTPERLGGLPWARGGAATARLVPLGA
jgi:hypothetical protein